MTKKTNYENLTTKKQNLENINTVQEFLNLLTGDNKKILEFDNSDLSNIDELGNKKFDVIVIEKTLENIRNPVDLLLKLQNYLESDGYFICVISNFLFAPNRINFLNGDLDSQFEETTFETNPNFYTLDSFLLLLDKANLKITQLNRIKQKFNILPNFILNNLPFSNGLIDSILMDPESETISYVLKVESGQNLSPKLRQYLLQTFPKNIVTSHLNSKNEFLQKVISDKDEMISGLETTISDKDIHLQKVISDKDKFLQRVISDKDELISGLDQTISDKDKFLQRVISDKDELISGLDQTISDKDERIFKTTEDFELEIEEIKKSKVWKLLRKLDSLRNKT
jgi:hypothetical protein